MGPFKDGWTEDDIESAIKRGLVNELLYVPIVVSMDPPDARWAQQICIGLAQHEDPTVRGNAILGSDIWPAQQERWTRTWLFVCHCWSERSPRVRKGAGGVCGRRPPAVPQLGSHERARLGLVWAR
jgi:hypothetical protein